MYQDINKNEIFVAVIYVLDLHILITLINILEDSYIQ